MAKVVKGVVSVIGAVASVLAVIPSPIQPIAAVVATVASVASTALNMIAPTKPKSSAQGQQTSFKLDPQSGIPYVIGRTLTGGNGVHRDTWGTDNQYQGFAIFWSGGGPVQAIEAFQADQTTIGFGAGYNAVGGFKDFMWLSTQLGACPSPALPTPVAGFPGWGAQSKLSGYAAGVWVTKFDKKGKKYSGGLPRPAAILQGVKVYDPRRDSTYPGGVGACRPLQENTYVYSENPWLHALTWALGRWQNGVKVMGVGMLLEQIAVASFVDAANIADANNWKAGGVVSSVDDKWEVMKMLAQAGGGQCIRLGACLTALVDAPRVAVATIRESDLVGKASISATQFQRSRINRLVPIYRSEAHGWEQVPADPVSFAVHEAEDGGRRTAETEFVLVQQIKQAAELAGYEIKNSREFGPIDLELKIQWLGIEPGDLVNLDMPSAGLANQPALALTRGIDPGTGNVALSLRSETPTKHAEALGKTTTIAPSPSLVPPDLSIVAAPTVGSWTLAAGIVEGPDGTGLPILVARGATDNPNASHVVFEYRPVVAPQGAMPPAPAIGDIAADSTGAEFVYEAGGWARRWLMQSTQDAGVTLQEFGAVTPQTSYQIAVSYVSRGVLGDRRVLGPVLTGSLVASGFAGAGDLAGVDYVRFGDGSIRQGNGVTTATDAGYRTDLGVSAGFVGQTVWATLDDPSATPEKLQGIDFGATRGENMVRNGNAEGGSLQGWALVEGGGPTLSVAEFAGIPEGRRAFVITKAAAGAAGAFGSAAIPVTPGRSYLIRAKIWGSAPSPAGLYFRLMWRSSFPSTGFVGLANREGSIDIVSDGPVSALPIQYQAIWQCPADMYWLTAAFYNWSTTSSNLQLAFDDVQMVELAGFDRLASDAVRLGGNVRRQDGATLVTDAAAITALGVSAGIVGQAPAATDPTIQSGATRDVITDADSGTDRPPNWYYANHLGRIVQERKAASALGLPATTHLGTLTTFAADYYAGAMQQTYVSASGVMYRRWHANTLSWQSWQLDYGTARRPAFDQSDIIDIGTTPATRANFRTDLGIAGGIAGQADWATYTGISTGNMAGRVSRLDSGAGRALDGRLLNSNNNFGLRALSAPPGMSATAQTSTATVDFNSSGILYPDWGGTLSLPSASFPGLSQSTQYYFWRNMPSPDGIGSSYGYSTNLVDALGTGKVYLGQYLTPAAGGGGGGGGGWGGENCVAADAIVRLADGRLVDAAEVKAGDRITVLASSFDGIAEHVVSANLVAEADCVRLVTESMIPLTLALNTPMTTKDRGWIIAANASGYEIPVLDAAGFRWEKVLDVEYVGRRPVARIDCENGTYAAGDIGGRFILSHNTIYKP